MPRQKLTTPWTLPEILLFLGIGAACLVALVAGAHISGSNVEEWDTPLFFQMVLPLAAIGTFSGGLLFPGHSWRWAVAPWWMQLVYMVWRHGPGNLWPIALVFWVVAILLFVGLARVGSSLSERIWSRTQ
jgi:hypothetical protein